MAGIFWDSQKKGGKKGCCHHAGHFVLTVLFVYLLDHSSIHSFLFPFHVDNDLEPFIHKDNYELIESPAICNLRLTMWVYFNGQNYNISIEDIHEPLKDMYNPDWSPILEKLTFSSYMAWDHDQNKMIQEYLSAQTIYDFVAKAMMGCIPKGLTEFMAIFSLHGVGLFGFGGDENIACRCCKLIETNAILISTLQAALQIDGAPTKFDVIGFDACLMQAVDTLDDFWDITKYYIVSEVVKLGHGMYVLITGCCHFLSSALLTLCEPFFCQGWAYNYLDMVDSALDMALNFQKNFVKQLQGDVQLTPKTLVVVDTDEFTIF